MSCLKPKLLRGYHKNQSVEVLDIPALEWAGRGRWEERGCDLYEFIGKYDALMALGVAELHMLDLGRSGKKFGPGFETKALANDRFRLELQTNDLDIDAVMARAKKIDLDILPARRQHDPMSSYLYKAATLVERYPKDFRDQLYKGLLDSQGNGWQLVESFPWLAVRIFTEEDDSNTARYLVKRGAKMRDIADAVGMPMCLKRFVPQATFRAAELSDLLCRHPDVVSHHCPEQLQRQRSWLSIIAKAYESGDEDFAVWAAIHWESISREDSVHWTHRDVALLNDWVKACANAAVSRSIEAEDIEKICQAMLSTGSEESAEALQVWWQGMNSNVEAGRLFNMKMSPQTVLRLSEEWHERAAVAEAADVEFPAPWIEGGQVDGYQIEPIKTAPELSRYAYQMHNCSSTYAHTIATGRCFLYVVLQENIPKAMVELERSHGRAVLSQLQGPCNEVVSEELGAAVDTWLEAA